MKNKKTYGRKRLDSRRYEDWLVCAEADLYAARLLCARDETLELSAFHCHQAIEKTLKGFYLYHKDYAPDGHNLTYLMRICIKIDTELDRWFDESIELNNFYISTRYPSDFPLNIDYDKASHCFQNAKHIYTYVLNLLTEEVFDDEKFNFRI